MVILGYISKKSVVEVNESCLLLSKNSARSLVALGPSRKTTLGSRKKLDHSIIHGLKK
jgi:hypothetical protein